MISIKEPENQEAFGSPPGQQLEKPSRHQKQFSPESNNYVFNSF